MAYLKRQSAVMSLLDHKARGPGSQERGPGAGPGAARSHRPGAGSPEAREHVSAEQGTDQSPDRDFSSDYMNNTSEEKDYDLGLPEEEEGTCYICYCPEDDSYLQGTDCEGQGYVAHDVHHLEMDECQEAVEEWTEPGPETPPRPAHPPRPAVAPADTGADPNTRAGPYLNLPPEAKHPADAQRSFKTKTRTSEERPKWPQEEDTRDEGNQTKASNMSKLTRTREKVTKLHIFSTEVGVMDISNSKEKNRNLRVCHTLADTNKPVMAPGSPESHLTPDDKDSKDQAVVIKPLPLPTLIIAPDGEFHPNSSDTDNTRDNTQVPTEPQLFSRMKHIKQEMAKNHLQFVRFEATDLHGVSRSKSIPAQFFQEKVIHGVYMPRGYLELIPNPKDNEVDHIRATCFNSDIVLMPELSTFRVLPWAKRTARVICDTFTVTGEPLLTSPRHIAKRQLSQLQDAGFSLLSAFIYDFCIFGIPEIINSKTISLPASALLNNHDQPFIQELVDGLYHTGANVESFSSSTRPGQMEICFLPEFGISSADNAFTLRMAVKEVARKYNYITSFFIETGFCNSGILSHSLWDVDEKKNMFCSSSGIEQLTITGKKWLAGLLKHSAALSCLMAPAVSCRKRYSKESKDLKESVPTTWGYNDNSCAFNIKCHGEKGTRIENKLGSATANPYLVLAATVAAGMDGLYSDDGVLAGPENSTDLHQSKPSEIPLKLEHALMALEEDQCLRQALGETFIRYFVAMKKYELENEETDAERNKFLEYFI